MTFTEQFDTAFAQCPLVAILRGVQPEEIGDIADALVAAGFRLIEVPLNSPRALDSVERLARRVGDVAVVGAGTVLGIDQVAAVADAGGKLIVAPNTDVLVIRAAVERGLVSIPGFQTPTEAFAAIDAGAAALKFFPAEAASPTVLRALRSVLPGNTRILPVGGITPATFADWQQAGANGFGLGSAVYRPGMKAADVGAVAGSLVNALKGWST